MGKTTLVETKMLWKADGKLFIPSTSEPGAQYHIYASYDGTLACPCIGFSWYDRCIHIEKAAQLLENYQPKTEGQQIFNKITWHDPVRVTLRRDGNLDSLPRRKRNWNDEN